MCLLRTGPAAVNLLIRDPLIGETEMAGRLVERRVDDRVFYDDLSHAYTYPTCASICFAGSCLPPIPSLLKVNRAVIISPNHKHLL